MVVGKNSPVALNFGHYRHNVMQHGAVRLQYHEVLYSTEAASFVALTSCGLRVASRESRHSLVSFMGEWKVANIGF